MSSLLHSGLFSDPTSVSDEMLLKNEVDEENVSEVLGSIESRIEGLLLGLEKKIGRDIEDDHKEGNRFQ